MKQFEATGFVISRRNLKDSDKIITALTLEQGKLSFVAKGVKKPKAKLQAHIEPLVESKFRFIKSGKIPVLVGAQNISTNKFFNTDSTTNLAALLITEVVDKFSVEELSNINLYEAYKKSLELLIRSKKTSLMLSYSILNILKAIGLEPYIDVNDNSKSIYFDLSGGEVSNKNPQSDGVAISIDLVKLWRVCMQKPSEMVERLSVDKKLLSESLNLLLNYLQYNADYKIKSIKVLSESTGLLQAS
jgi:DNA repair protein RecO (recombination protein O)